ncbi:hypothetical protein GCM10009864_08110 [Streptomyces lunalinharesii]|uniref:DUF397 domain-containing protein n=1 Tax=Streptomyces lunalinharesii TaxID=333384 RepID=A0ABN3RA25_9ACTN
MVELAALDVRLLYAGRDEYPECTWGLGEECVEVSGGGQGVSFEGERRSGQRRRPAGEVGGAATVLGSALGGVGCGGDARAGGSSAKAGRMESRPSTRSRVLSVASRSNSQAPFGN